MGPLSCSTTKGVQTRKRGGEESLKQRNSEREGREGGGLGDERMRPLRPPPTTVAASMAGSLLDFMVHKEGITGDKSKESVGNSPVFVVGSVASRIRVWRGA